MKPHIKTWSGHQFDFINPQPTDVSIRDIAHALSLQCRFNGHCQEFYSVAEHSVEVSKLVAFLGYDNNVIMTALLHDAAEAYIGDIVSPLKKALPDYQRIEARVEEVIAEKYSLEYPFPEVIHRADKEILAKEFNALSPFTDAPSSALRCLSPKDAENEFLDVFRRLSVGR